MLEWGNLKLAAPLLPVDEPELKRMRLAIPTPSWLAASTHPGEEEIVIAAHRILVEKFPGLVTVIAPRHPVRGSEVAALATGLAVARRSLDELPEPGGIADLYRRYAGGAWAVLPDFPDCLRGRLAGGNRRP